MQAILVTVSIPNKSEEMRLRGVPVGKEQTEAFVEIQTLNESNALASAVPLKAVPANDTLEICRGAVSQLFPNNHEQQLCFKFNMPSDTTMEEMLRVMLRTFHVSSAIWLADITGTRLRVQFHIVCDVTHKQLMLALRQWQIGVRYDSFVASSPSFTTRSEINETRKYSNGHNLTTDVMLKTAPQKHALMQRFIGAIKTRLFIMKILKEMHDKAVLSFNFGLLLVSAATIACFALADNNAIYIVSCMLLSPLIGPIVAGVFGLFIGNKRLALLGLRNCALGIMVATVVGLSTGLILALVDPRYRHGQGLTKEMMMRTDLYSLFTGSIVAITCGVAIAIAILNKNTSSLVGAAIAGSLLPPAVNAGFIWSMACIARLYETEAATFNSNVLTLRFAATTSNELFVLGSISMCLTFSNIVFIYLAGYLMLKLKENMPSNTIDTAQWQQSMALVRSYQRDDNATNIVMDELHKLSELDQRTLTLNNAIMCDILRKQNGVAHPCRTYPPKTAPKEHIDTLSDTNPLTYNTDMVAP